MVKHNSKTGIYYVKVSNENTVYYLEQVTSYYGGEPLLVNKQLLKGGIDDIPKIKELKEAINKKQSESQFLADLKKIHKVYAQSVYDNRSINSISNSSEKSNTKNLVLDRDYMQAARNGDEEKAAAYVEQAAKEWGAFSDGKPEPINLYHGTTAFGFTEFDLKKTDDGRSIFLTSDLETAQSYSGSFDKRKIKETFGHLSLEDTVKKLNHIYKDVYAFKIAGSGMLVEINESGIEETFNYQNFNRHSKNLKLLKLASIRKVPEIIRKGKLVSDNEDNYHNSKSAVKYAYIEGTTGIYDKPYKIKISVRKSLQKNKFWVHQISVAEKKNAAFDLPAGENSKTGYRAESDNERVSQSGDNVKNLVYDYSADDRIREQEAELIDKLNSLYDRIDE